MKKGEQRREQILDAAEKLFLGKGYDETTVQDVLDELGLSKGGFYHHFESKDQVLAAICTRRMEVLGKKAQNARPAGAMGATDRINAILDAACLWQEENARFLSLYVRVAFRPGNALMRESVESALEETVRPPLNEAIRFGVSRSEFFTPHPEKIARLVVAMMNLLNEDVCRLLLDAGPEPPSMMRLLDNVEVYRHAIERLLDAPYGSITLYDMARMSQVTSEVWARLRRAQAHATGGIEYAP